MGLKIVGCSANTGIRLNRGTTSRFVGGVRILIYIAAVSPVTVESVIAAELVTHFVGNVIDPETVADWRINAGGT